MSYFRRNFRQGTLYMLKVLPQGEVINCMFLSCSKPMYVAGLRFTFTSKKHITDAVSDALLKDLLNHYCPKSMHVSIYNYSGSKLKLDHQQLFGYVMDVLFPECVIRLLMEVQDLVYEEVLIVMSIYNATILIAV